jgi:hypothetical protein
MKNEILLISFKNLTLAALRKAEPFLFLAGSAPGNRGGGQVRGAGTLYQTAIFRQKA